LERNKNKNTNRNKNQYQNQNQNQIDKNNKENLKKKSKNYLGKLQTGEDADNKDNKISNDNINNDNEKDNDIYSNINNEIKKNDKIRMNLKILKGNEVLFNQVFYNSLLIKNIYFENKHINAFSQLALNEIKNKNTDKMPNKESLQYKFLCEFDLSELDKNSYEDNFIWEIRLFTSETVLFSKDTSKEDSEIQVKVNWEREESGRSEMAKTSRFRFLALKKQEKNIEILNEDEIRLLNTERKKKPTHISMLDKINKRPSSIMDLNRNFVKSSKNAIGSVINKNLKGKINFLDNDDDNPYFKYERLELNPLFINSANHKSNYIRNFIKYASMERTITKGEDVPQKQSNN
jgi:hypothetical protein